jgi:hypothetical protein
VRRQAVSQRLREHQPETTEIQPVRSRTPFSLSSRAARSPATLAAWHPPWRLHQGTYLPYLCPYEPPTCPNLHCILSLLQTHRRGSSSTQACSLPVSQTHLGRHRGSGRASARASSHYLHFKISMDSTYRTSHCNFGLWTPTTRNLGSRSRSQSAVKMLTVSRRAAGGRTTPPVYWMIRALNSTKNAESIPGRPDGGRVLRDDTHGTPRNKDAINNIP